MSVHQLSATSANPHVHDWETAMLAQGLSPRTIDNRVRILSQLERDTGTPAHLIDTAAIVRWIAARPWTTTTKATHHASLRAWFRWLGLQGIVDIDPMLRVPAPRRPRGTPRPVTDAQLARVLDQRMHRRTRVMILLAALQGLRIHEIAKIRGEDVDLVAGTLAVVGKGGVDASLPLHPKVAVEAETMPRRGYWFTTYTGPGRGVEPVRRESVGEVVARLMRAAGVDATAHQLRHWYGTTLVDSGTDLRTAQTLLRHASLATTQIYTKVNDARRAEAINRLDPLRGAEPDR